METTMVNSSLMETVIEEVRTKGGTRIPSSAKMEEFIRENVIGDYIMTFRSDLIEGGYTEDELVGIQNGFVSLANLLAPVKKFLSEWDRSKMVEEMVGQDASCHYDMGTRDLYEMYRQDYLCMSDDELQTEYNDRKDNEEEDNDEV